MVECRRCGAEIRHLIYTALERVYADAVYDHSLRSVLYLNEEHGSEKIETEYKCPYCDEVLNTCEYDVEQFLKGEDC